jgi:hypothetical protein|tara:strand:- start:3186 stop:3572 length:387 start_codon:yes stop_codon:yes gene_type:complete
MEQISLLITAFLFGGMLLFSVGFGPLVLRHLEGSVARLFIRNTFPYFYLFVLASSLLAAATFFTTAPLASVALLVIFLTTLLARQILMPAINIASDEGDRKKFKLLHALSVVITLAHIFISGAVLYFL